MILGEVICALGVGILAPHSACFVQEEMPVSVMAATCDKHEQEIPASILKSSPPQLGTGIEQPCKAVIIPDPGPK